LVPDGESVRQLGGTEDRVLQCQRRLALLVELVNPLQALAEPPRQNREQHVILGSERPSFGELDVQHEHAAGVLKRDGSHPGLRGVGRE
jgi:hypothetical protein